MGTKNIIGELRVNGDLVVTKHFSEGLNYTLSDDGTYYSVTGIGTCEDTDIVIPSTYTSLPVKSIGPRAFDGCVSLTSVVIGDSVTSIGNMAFASCTSLTSIEIPNSVISMGWHAVAFCLSLVIYCEAEFPPEGWDASWNPNNRPVIWGFANDFNAVNDKLGDISAVLEALITKSQNILEGGTE